VTLGAVLLVACSSPQPKAGPDVVLISIDTLRADHLSGLGYGRETTPNIDRLIRDGLVFDNCFSHASDTRLAFAALMSGFLPHETATMNAGAPAEEEIRLPGVLRRHGYRTAAVVSNYVLRGSRGWSIGFDVYDDEMHQAEAVRSLPERTAPDTTKRALELLREEREHPLFLWVHYQDPHGPYTPPRQHDIFHEDTASNRVPLNRESLSGSGGIPAYQILDDEADFHDYVARYDGEIRFADQYVGRLLDGLEHLGMYDSALIIFTSDHGEGLGEHDYYFAHGEEIWAPLLRVPLVFRLGDRVRGRRTDPAQHVDIVPTIYKLLGIEIDPRFRGRDLLAGPVAEVERFGIVDSPVATERRKLSITHGGFQLIHHPATLRDELYDLEGDPLALLDLAAEPQHRERVSYLRDRALEISREDRPGVVERERPELTEDELEKLRALGYLH